MPMKHDPAPARQEPVRLSAERDFSLGDLLIRPSVSEAVRDGRSQHLEPRVMQVLVALAGADGAVVSRDELIERCWDGRVVGEAAINRCISRLRAVADRGDGARSFNVETIARVGYRLQPIAAFAEAGAAPQVVRDVPRMKRAALLAVASIALVVAAMIGISDYTAASRSAGAPVSTGSPPSVAVLPFKNLSPAADAGSFGDAIQDEILPRLAKIGSLKVISRTSAAEVVKQPGTLADIARRLGVE